jgi:hypothetical protein
VYWHADAGEPPHICVLGTHLRPLKACRVTRNRGYGTVSGDLVLDGTEDEVLAEVRRAARAVLRIPQP